MKKGFTVNIEEGAGFSAKFRDDDYAQVGGKIVNAQTALASDIVLKVRQPHETDIPLLRDNSTLISFLYPARNKPLIDTLSQKKMNAFGMKCLIFFSSIKCAALEQNQKIKHHLTLECIHLDIIAKW